VNANTGIDGVVTTEHELRELYGFPGERAVAKEHATLDEHCRTFIAHSPFLVMGTAGADGRCDVSPKGDAPGFVRVLDDHHLAIPDRLGTTGSTACATSSRTTTSACSSSSRAARTPCG
jgi:predicted pyridoxine 5'-phosphate oxidase superfamily flavin-nucleotide-binding protein